MKNIIAIIQTGKLDAIHEALCAICIKGIHIFLAEHLVQRIGLDRWFYIVVAHVSLPASTWGRVGAFAWLLKPVAFIVMGALLYANIMTDCLISRQRIRHAVLDNPREPSAAQNA